MVSLIWNFMKIFLLFWLKNEVSKNNKQKKNEMFDEISNHWIDRVFNKIWEKVNKINPF